MTAWVHGEAAVAPVEAIHWRSRSVEKKTSHSWRRSRKEHTRMTAKSPGNATSASNFLALIGVESYNGCRRFDYARRFLYNWGE